MRVENVICALDKEWTSGWDQKMGLLHSIQFFIKDNNTLVFSITNHMIIYKTTFKSYMQYIKLQLYTYFKKCFLFLMCP